jgi:glycosyltransferase involved in cell wall biosynthesis
MTDASSMRGQHQTVLLLTSQLGIGGAERHTLSLATLLGREFRVVVAYLKPDGDLVKDAESLPLLDLQCLHAKRRIDWGAARYLAALCDKHGAQVIVCANAFALMHAQLARWFSRKPIVVVEIFHTTKLRTVKEHLELVFYRPWFWAAHHLVFVCEAQRRYWRPRALWARRTHVIYNGVDLTYFSPAPFASRAAVTREELGFGTHDRVVGICAVLRPEKAHADLLSAAAQCASEGRQWKVLIVGDGPLRTSIERLVAQLALADSVRITGFQSDVRKWLAACDVIALPSTSETFSVAAIEAMAMGKPLIISDVGGAREQVENGVNGLLFCPGNVSELTQLLKECWDRTKTQAMGIAARSRVERDFSQKKMFDRYVALLRQAFDAVRPHDSDAKPRIAA